MCLGLMRLFNQLMLTVLYITSVVFIWEVTQLQRDMATFRNNMVWNVDAVRERYRSDTEFAFKRGCFVGVDYPPEYRKDQTGFNNNSPTSYCHREFLSKAEEYFLDQLPKLGRSE